MSGPWSDLPPPDRQEKTWRPWRLRGTPQVRFSRLHPAQRRRGAREPIINNWRGLLIIGFLLFVAPVIVRWVVEVVRGMSMGG